MTQRKTRIDLDPSKLLGFKLVLPQVKIGEKPVSGPMGPKIGEKPVSGPMGPKIGVKPA
ncbi:hypothetical protein KJ059_10555 [Myxococcota bacterium]|nr:hypothetical protein [Myxococcota bacterium]MCZ7619156.1 hypothetical protein [Myxococcota bacterium]